MSINVQSPVAPEIESLMAEYEEQIRYCTLQIGRLWEQNEEGKRNMKTNEVVNTTVRDLENEIELWRYRACAWKTKDGVFVSGHDVVMHRYEDGSHLNFFACDLTKSQQQSAYFVNRHGEGD